MKMKLMAGVALAAATAASGAWALNDGWYGAIDVGAHQLSPLESVPTSDSSAAPFKYKTKPDVLGFGRIGYQLFPHLRLEIEGGYRPSKLKGVSSFGATNPIILCNANSSAAYDPVNGFSGTCGRPNDTIDAFTAMGNVIVDVLPNSKIDPFIGGGVGAIFDKVRARGNLIGPGVADPDGSGFLVSQSDTEFAYQAIGGIAFQASSQLAIDLTYRYMTSDPVKFGATAFSAGGTQLYKARFEDNSLTLGLRYAFAGPPPPPPPPAPTYDTRDYVIYFPFDQFVITPEAQAVLQDAAKYSTDGHATKETVVGHTDTSGSVAYNLRLSERRAKATADGLVSLGVPASTLDVSWTGKADLAVPTPDGVKEPLNRRSTIHIQF